MRTITGWSRWQVCPRCHGDGEGRGWDGSCLRCKGAGRVRTSADPKPPPEPVLLTEPRPLFPSVRAEVDDSGPELEPTIDVTDPDFVLTRESFLRLILGEALR